MEDMQAAKQILGEIFGFSDFKPGQKKIISAIFAGRDVLGIMPTGAGKSICYQVPALVFPGITLVISPLIALMKDQVRALGAAGIKAAYLNSSLTLRQYQKALDYAAQGRYKIIYVAPERLATEAFQSFAKSVNISMVAVDEAHCVSQWGHDFRTSYLEIEKFLRILPHRPRVSAFTATATPAVTQDIIALLQLQSPELITTGFDRPNLHFSVEIPRDRRAALLRFVQQHQDESGIIYCATRKAVESICQLLQDHDMDVTRYHAGLPHDERMQNQDDFRFDHKKIMVATNAFGMGIDKQTVRYVLHYNMPKNLESYYQEAGRAGRDGAPANCVLFYSGSDIHTALYLIENGARDADISEEERKKQQKIDKQKLESMKRYCNSRDCLRKQILEYFGESAEATCKNCGNCNKLTATSSAVATAISHSADVDKSLYEILTSIRADFAKLHQLPQDLIFTDYTLREMCEQRPQTESQLLDISGVTPAKAKRFGKQFLKAITRHGNRKNGI